MNLLNILFKFLRFLKKNSKLIISILIHLNIDKLKKSLLLIKSKVNQTYIFNLRYKTFKYL